MSELCTIQTFVQRVAEAIAAALSIDVEIVDDQLYRVGATGNIKKELGSKQKRGYVNKFVINTGENYVVTNPGEHNLCKSCDLKGNCFYTAGLFCAIKLEGKSIGLISLISFNEGQRKTLLAKKICYLNFCEQMADLLASKVSEFRTMAKLSATSKHLETIVDTIQEGIVAINTGGKVTYFNKAAENMLGIKQVEICNRDMESFLPNALALKVLSGTRAIDSTEVVYVGKRKAHVLSSAYPIRLGPRIVGVVEKFTAMNEVQKLAYRFNVPTQGLTFDDIIGDSSSFIAVKERARKVATSSSTVLMQGESGTGKGLFARAIHFASKRSGKPLVIINCGAIPDTLLESELFGYEEGAFTGAKHGGKPGKFELADGGTVFLDEIGELPLYLQSKLLRVLQERCMERVGGVKTIPIDVRVIAATNKDLTKMVASGDFRADLYYRLNVIPLRIPSLRERSEDVSGLLSHFLQKYNKLFDKNFQDFSQEAYRVLKSYHWPGNARELENSIEYACNLETGSEINVNNLPPQVMRPQSLGIGHTLKIRLEEGKKEVERQVFQEAFKIYGTSGEAKEKISQALGISRATLYRRLKEIESESQY